jgi:hypothetical protein
LTCKNGMSNCKKWCGDEPVIRVECCGLSAKCLPFPEPMLFLRWYLWIAPNILLAPCIYGLLRKLWYRDLPLFVGYTALQFLFFAVSITLDRMPSVTLSLYCWVILILTALSAILELAVVYELAESLIVSRSSLSRVLRPLMRWVIAALLLITAVSVATLNQGSIERVMTAFQALDLPTSAIKLGLLLTLVLFACATHIVAELACWYCGGLCDISQCRTCGSSSVFRTWPQLLWPHRYTPFGRVSRLCSDLACVHFPA